MAAAPKHKIVVVEDEGLIAADLESRLKAAGYSVTGTADSAPQALKLIRATSPDLVLMDIRIKGDMDGIQVADQVRQEFDVPVVYLTAYEDRGTLARASETQAFGYIKKPIASSSLRGSIEMAIAKHRHERDLRAQRDWLAASFSAVPYAVLVTDGSGRIRYINSQAEELIGWNAEQALGHPSRELLRLFYRESGSPLEDFVPVAMLQGETLPLPEGVWLKGSEGRNYAIEGSVAPRWRDGRIEGAVIAITDTTLRQFEEEQTRQENKQDALLRLADGIARELPELNRTAEDCARLLEALPGDSDLRQDAEAIERAAMDAFAVTHRLRRFLEPPEVRPAQVRLNEVLSRLESAWKQIQPNLVLRVEPDPVPVQADEWQLTRSLVSILLHARRRMTETSDLSVDTSSAVLEQMSHSARIRIVYTTRDEDAAALERVFEPSWSGDSNDLPVAYRIVKKMGGLIAARLEKGNTVTFDIYLSRASADAAGAPIPEPEKPAVLLIEPNPEVRRVLHLHFQRHGYKLLEAQDCEEGLLLANLYSAQIPLIVANPDNEDKARADLAEKLTAFRPESRVRLLAGYYESCRAAASSGMAAVGTRHLTKWDLLAWVQDAFASINAGDALA
jgi:two-component system cell cycle sensor histidine kinase/response regulator CckA